MEYIRKFTLLTVVFIILIVACGLEPPIQNYNGSINGYIPADRSSDVLRTFGNDFNYETLLPVVIDFEFINSSKERIPEVVFSFLTSSGEIFFTAKSDDEGIFHGKVFLPSMAEDIILTIQHSDYNDRQVLLEDMVLYSEINRRFTLLVPDNVAMKLYNNPQDLNDSDGDGITDEQDAFPDDEKRAFLVRVPAEENLTLAYEDLFPRYDSQDPTKFFDADFNDFVVQYFIEEIYNADNELVEVKGNAKAVAKLAGYSHTFGMYFPFEALNAKLSVSYFSKTGRRIWGYKDKTVSDGANIVLFWNTKYALDEYSEFTLQFTEPLKRENFIDPPYDPYLLVLNTGYDIHMLGKDPLPNSKNPTETDEFKFRHPVNGMPWALNVPMNWEYPAELEHIENLYPAFKYWRESNGEYYPDWYLMKGIDPGPPSTGNNPPYPVTGPDQKPVFNAYTSADQYYQLEIQEVDDQKDPDGDVVYFRSSELPSYMKLDSEEGLVTILGDPLFAGPPKETMEVEFWSEDEQGADTKDEAYVVKFTLKSS
ncbi:MAG: LruC domain-containing protein [Spirochaetaceae bacterium]|nr:LruC domain-containing protein [Spirochaetaceae bacterium]MCF7951684.1 LruC domain-containing protein [Spirochaetaceae bacterium]